MNRDATPQRKFVVFVSSVTSEFSDLRRNLWISIYKAGHIPVVLEENPSVPNKVRQYIEKQVKETDIFVFVLGQEYGRRGTTRPEVPSYIDFELDLAIQNR